MSHHNRTQSFPIHLNLNTTANESDREEKDLPLGLGNDANSLQTIPSLCGIPLNYISLFTLAVQNSLLTLIMHYSRVSTPPSRAYSAGTAVLMNELLKGSVSLVIAFMRIDHHGSSTTSLPIIDIPPTPYHAMPTTSSAWTLKGIRSRLARLGKEVFSPDCWKLSIPAILYVIQNNLQYVAASNLEAATFQVTYQMKILTTAAFSVLLLRKKLTSLQWISLLFLALGVGVVQIQVGAAKVLPNSPVTIDVHTMDAAKGFLAVTAACFTSGLAGVYFEMVLKNSQASLWVRNVQLSLFSLLPALVPILFSASTREGGWFSSLFHHFGAWAWATVLIQVFGGLVTAMVIKYSDNILKGFATSLSIVISFLASVALFDFHMTFTFVLGSLIVLVATWLYNQQPKRASIAIAKDTIGWWSTGHPEKWRGPGGYPARSPSAEPIYKGLSVLSSTTSLPSSLTSSAISLSSIPLSTVDSSPNLFDSDLEQRPFTFTR